MTLRCAGISSGIKWTQSAEFLINVLERKPIVTTGSATGISGTGAAVTGTINPKGLTTTAYFQYGPTTGYGATTPIRNVGSANTAVAITGTLTGLAPSTTYHYQLVATNDCGTSQGADRTFTTNGPPTVVTGPVSSITWQGAVLSGTVSPNGYSSSFYFEYGPTTDYGSSTAPQNLDSPTAKARVTGTLTGLTPGTNYHYRIVATNILDTTRGPDGNFTTAPPPSTNADLSKLSITSGTLAPAFSSGTTSYSASMANRVASIKVTPVHADAKSVIAIRKSGTGNFSSLASGASASVALSPGDNLVELKVTAEDTITTKLYSLTLHRGTVPVTGAASESGTSAVVEGSVDGHAFSASFQYGLTTGYGASAGSQPIASGSGTVALSATLAGLSPAGLYHYRTVAVTGGVADFGPDKTFVTSRSYAKPEVATQGDIAPQIDGTATFRSFGNPAINYALPAAPEDYDHWAFQALISGSGINAKNNSGIWLYTGSAATLVARTGNPAPGGGVFAKLLDPVLNNHDEVAFLGTVSGTGFTAKNNVGLWATTSGSLHLVASTRAALDSTGAKASSFAQVVLADEAGPVFLANLVSGTGGVTAANNQGIWMESNSGLTRLLSKGDVLQGGTLSALSIFAAPKLPVGVTGQTRNINPAGDLSFLATFADKRQGAFVLSSGSVCPPQALKGAPAPDIFGGPSRYDSVGNPIINETGNTAFQAVLTGTAKGAAKYQAILAETGTDRVLGIVALSGSFAPNALGQTGTAAVFASLGDPVFNKHDQVAFLGKLKSGTQGVWATTSGTLALVAQTKTQAPECASGAKFASFVQLVLPDEGGVVFLATLAGTGVSGSNNQGIWAVDTQGNLRLVARTGDALLVNGQPKIVSKVSLFTATAGTNGQTRSFNPIGDLIYKVIFTDKTQALRKVLFP
jgi:hypothetical protein